MSKRILVNFKKKSAHRLIEISNSETAYIKQESLNNKPVWSIYNDKGEKLGYAANRDVAVAVLKQNEFVGLSVH